MPEPATKHYTLLKFWQRWSLYHMRSNIWICSLNEQGVEECAFNWARHLKALGGDTYLFQISFTPNTLVWDECGLGALIFTFLNKMTERRCSSSIAEELFCQLAAGRVSLQRLIHICYSSLSPLLCIDDEAHKWTKWFLHHVRSQCFFDNRTYCNIQVF